MSRILSHVGHGRVRRPKNIIGADGATINAADNNPLDSAATLSDDVTQTVTAASLSGVTLTLTVGDASGIAVGDQVQLQGAAGVMTNRSFSVTAVGVGSVSIKLDLDAAQVVKSAAASGAVGATLRRRTTDGFRTENAKFLHLFMDASGAGDGNTVIFTVHAYNYAFGRWENLQLPLAIDKGDAAIGDADGEPVVAEAAAVAAGTVSDVYSDVTFSVANNTKRMVTIPIEGVDRVAFTSNANDKSNVTLSAAISTI